MNCMPVKILPIALEDVNQALIYIALDNPAAADRFYDSLMKALEQASAYPNAAKQIAVGKRVQRLYYKLYVRPYHVYYRIISDTIIVMRVLHERMDADRHL